MLYICHLCHLWDLWLRDKFNFALPLMIYIRFPKQQLREGVKTNLDMSPPLFIHPLDIRNTLKRKNSYSSPIFFFLKSYVLDHSDMHIKDFWEEKNLYEIEKWSDKTYILSSQIFKIIYPFQSFLVRMPFRRKFPRFRRRKISR